MRSERSGGQAGSILDSAHSVPNGGPLQQSVPHKATVTGGTHGPGAGRSGAGRRLRPFARQKDSPPPRRGRTSTEQAVGSAGGTRPQPGAVSPERRAFMTVCPPQNHQRQEGLRGREPGAWRRLRTFALQKDSPPPRKGEPVRSERWGGQAGPVLDSAHSIPNGGPLRRSVPHKATNDRRGSGGGSREPGEDYEPSPAKNTPLLPEEEGAGAE